MPSVALSALLGCCIAGMAGVRRQSVEGLCEFTDLTKQHIHNAPMGKINQPF